MKFVKAYNSFFDKYFPSPMLIAFLLTFLSFGLAFFLTNEQSSFAYIADLASFWYKGVFKSSLLAFTLHMMLILVLGHIIALSKPVERFTQILLKSCTTTANSALIVSLFTLLVAYFNWGFALVFGALFARKVAEKFSTEGKPLNYPLVAVAAYIGMMVWHGGLSGSAPITVASKTHDYVEQMGVIDLSLTTFSLSNIILFFVFLFVIPLFFYILGKRSSKVKNYSFPLKESTVENTNELIHPADRIEQSNLLGIFIGFLFLSFFFYLSIEKIKSGESILKVLDLSSTNLLLMGLAFFVHGSLHSFKKALSEAVGDVSGILIQFPIYFGIMGIITQSGLSVMIADLFTSISTDKTLPFFTFISAGLLNIFIPSGGGQWQVQAPIILESAKQSQVALPKLIMAMCYGDQLTNMLQPFWALPLLQITGLKAKDILPYCLLAFALGFIIFTIFIFV